jgi:hypothetical protein
MLDIFVIKNNMRYTYEKLEAERKAIAAEGDKQAAIIGAQAQEMWANKPIIKVQ